MKKLFSLILVISLCALSLSACGRSDDSSGKVSRDDVLAGTPVPEEGSHGEEDQSAALKAMPTLAPLEPAEATEGGGAMAGLDDGYFDIDALLNQDDDAGVADAPSAAASDAAESQPQPAVAAPASGGIDASAYQYTTLTDTSLGFTFNYPSHWVNVPGVYTVCFREPAEEGKFPARVAITVKQMVHTPDEQVMTEQLTAYMRIIHKQYDSKTFQSGSPNMQDNFLGRQAFSNTYLAFSGDNEVKGYVIGTAVGRKICVFHFCAAYEEYAALESTMKYMLRSITAVENN